MMSKLETPTYELPFVIRPNRYSAKHNIKPVNFYCIAPQAAWVALIGDFNGWQPWETPMQRQPDGSWLAQVQLHHGYHQYVFLVDGVPVLDPNAHGTARKEKGEPVSLIAVS